MSRDGHTAFLRRALVLPVAALLYYLPPALPLHKLDGIADLHPGPSGKPEKPPADAKRRGGSLPELGVRPEDVE
jgi:hypothetical protein